jgi:hypothetical protein
LEFLLLRRQKRPNVTITAIKIRAPMTVPAIAAIVELFPGPEVGEGEEEPEGERVLVDVGLEVRVELVAVEEGEELLRQVESSVIPTVLTSEVPPLRPSESVIVNSSDVPAATSAVQLKDADPIGG